MGITTLLRRDGRTTKLGAPRIEMNMLHPHAIAVHPGEPAELQLYAASLGLPEGARETVRSALVSGRCFIAADIDGIKGVITYQGDFFGCALIEFLMVLPQARREGIATRLIRAVEQHVGAGKLFISTNKSNHIAQRLFERSGFIASGVVENLDPGDPELIYFKWIAAHPR